MKILKQIVFAAATILVIGTVWLNRDLYQVVNTAIVAGLAAMSVLWLASDKPHRKIALAVIGALFALCLVFIFNAPEPIENVFPVAFFFERPDNLPIVIPNRPFSMFPELELFDKARQANPAAFTTHNDRETVLFDIVLYEEFLERLLVDWIASTYSRTWRMQFDHFDSGSISGDRFRPLVDGSAYNSTILTAPDLEQKFDGNRFASVHSSGPPEMLALPEGMRLTIGRPQGNISTAEIRFEDRYC